MCSPVQKNNLGAWSDGLSEHWHDESTFKWNDVSFVRHNWETETSLIRQQVF